MTPYVPKGITAMTIKSAIILTVLALILTIVLCHVAGMAYDLSDHLQDITTQTQVTQSTPVP